MSRFRRKLVAITLAATMILSSMASTVFANDNQATYEESANILKGYGVFVGDNGNLMLDQGLKRQDAVIIALRLMGTADSEFENYEKISDFTDVTDQYYLPIIGMAQDLGLIEGMSDGTFGFNQQITAQQLQTILLRSLGYEITDDIYNEVPQMAEELGLNNLLSVEASEQINRAVVAQMMLNTLNTNVKDGDQKLGDVLGLFENEASPLEMTAAMLNDSAIKVTFNRAVADTSKLAFEVKGTVAVETTATWNEAKTEATLAAPSTLLEGAYTVKATGDTFAEGKDVATIVVAKNGVAKIELLSDKIVKAAGNTATVHYRLLDNYGVDITKDVVSESDLSIASSKALGADNFDIDAEKGVMTVKFAGAFTDTEKSVALTIIATKTGKSLSSTLTVSDEAKVDAVTLGPVSFEKTTPVTTKILTGEATAAYIAINAKDQYGNAVVDETALNEDGTGDILIVKSDASLVLRTEVTTDENGNDIARLVVDTQAISTAKVVTVTMVSKLAGKSSTISLDIKEPAKADKVSLGSQTALVAENDAAAKFVLPMTVVDQYGIQLTPDEVVKNTANITVNGSGALAGLVEIAQSGENKGKIVNNAAMPAEGTYVITVSTNTGSVATYTLEVKEAAYAKSIRVANAPAANLLMGAETKMDYKFFDQYGREMKNPGAAVVKLEISNADILTAVADSQTTSAADKIIETTANTVAVERSVLLQTSTNEGGARITAKLYKDGAAISSVDSSVSVVKGMPSTLTFEISDIPTLVAQAGNGLVDGTDAYARPVIITAKDANGKTYAIPQDRILSVTTADTSLIALSADEVAATIDAQDGNYVVAAKAEAAQFGDDDTKTATIKVLVSTDNGVKEITKTVTVAKEDPKTVKVVFADMDLAAGNPYALDKDAKEITEISGSITEIDNTTLFVFTVDQYGVYTKVAAPTFVVVNGDRLNVTPTYNVNNTLDGITAASIKANEAAYVMYQDGSVYGTFTVKTPDGTLN